MAEIAKMRVWGLTRFGGSKEGIVSIKICMCNERILNDSYIVNIFSVSPFREYIKIMI